MFFINISLLPNIPYRQNNHFGENETTDSTVSSGVEIAFETNGLIQVAVIYTHLPSSNSPPAHALMPMKLAGLAKNNIVIFTSATQFIDYGLNVHLLGGIHLRCKMTTHLRFTIHPSANYTNVRPMGSGHYISSTHNVNNL